MSWRFKAIIEEGVIHSQNKFDNVGEYAKKDKIDEYKEVCSKEVMNHLAEETDDFEGVINDENFLTFIPHRVNIIISSQVADEINYL